MTLQKSRACPLAGGPIMLQRGGPMTLQKTGSGWPHEPANWQARRPSPPRLAAVSTVRRLPETSLQESTRPDTAGVVSDCQTVPRPCPCARLHPCRHGRPILVGDHADIVQALR
jgi:hypothetical protein